MKKTIDLQWNSGMSFQTNLDGHILTVDADEQFGGQNNGPRPKVLLLVSLAGCTAMDVVSILKKMRVEPTWFNVKVEGDMTEEHPKKFTELKVIYEFKGENLPMDKLEKAVKLSQEQYCGVSATLAGSVKLDYEIKILN